MKFWKMYQFEKKGEWTKYVSFVVVHELFRYLYFQNLDLYTK